LIFDDLLSEALSKFEFIHLVHPLLDYKLHL
jgi:hypothetical protein